MKEKWTIVFCFIISTVFAQNDSVTQGVITYKNKFTQIDKSEDYYVSKLFFNVTESLSLSHKYGMDEDNGNRMDYESGNVRVVQSAYDEKGTMYYRNNDTKQFLFRFKANKPFPAYLVTDTWIDIDWQLKEEYKTILNYKVQKAIGEFRGRKWTVWFSRDIPMSFGPLKLHGLPGVILEAKDSKFCITATNICYPCKTGAIEVPDEDLKWSIKEYAHIWDNYATYTVLENNKLGLYGLFLSEVPTEASIREKRKNRMDLQYEWEDKNTKRAIYDKKIINQVLVPKESRPAKNPPRPSIKF